MEGGEEEEEKKGRREKRGRENRGREGEREEKKEGRGKKRGVLEGHLLCYSACCSRASTLKVSNIS